MIKGNFILKREKTNFKIGFCSVIKDLNELEKLLNQLHSEEYLYYTSLKFDKRKTSYLLGKIAAKNSVLEHSNHCQAIDSFAIKPGVFSFPVVKQLNYQNVQVSISHCDNRGVAVAFPEEHPLGIDLEKIEENNVETMKTLIVLKEYDLLKKESLDIVSGSTYIWTIKEALSKILRTGLTIDFKLLEIESLQKNNGAYISTFKHFPQYKAISHKIGGYIYTLVMPKNTVFDLDHFWGTLIEHNNDIAH